MERDETGQRCGLLEAGNLPHREGKDVPELRPVLGAVSGTWAAEAAADVKGDRLPFMRYQIKLIHKKLLDWMVVDRGWRWPLRYWKNLAEERLELWWRYRDWLDDGTPFGKMAWARACHYSIGYARALNLGGLPRRFPARPQT